MNRLRKILRQRKKYLNLKFLQKKPRLRLLLEKLLQQMKKKRQNQLQLSRHKKTILQWKRQLRNLLQRKSLLKNLL